jgi:hypothetical protein
LIAATGFVAVPILVMRNVCVHPAEHPAVAAQAALIGRDEQR